MCVCASRRNGASQHRINIIPTKALQITNSDTTRVCGSQFHTHTHARNNIITRPLVHLGVREEIFEHNLHILRVNKQKRRKTKQQHRKHVEESGRVAKSNNINLYLVIHHHESSTTRVCCCPVFVCWLPKWDSKPTHLPPKINFRKFSKRLFVFM